MQFSRDCYTPVSYVLYLPFSTHFFHFSLPFIFFSFQNASLCLGMGFFGKRLIGQHIYMNASRIVWLLITFFSCVILSFPYLLFFLLVLFRSSDFLIQTPVPPSLFPCSLIHFPIVRPITSNLEFGWYIISKPTGKTNQTSFVYSKLK